MKHSISIFISLIIGAFIFASCSVDVDVGRNGKIETPEDQKKGENPKDEKETDKQKLADDNKRPETPPDIIQNYDDFGTCFGPVEELPQVTKDFCDSVPDHLKEEFSRHLYTMCEEKLLSNLFRPECGWDGKSERGRYARVMEKTDLNSSSRIYHYYVAIAFHLVGGKKRDAVDIDYQAKTEFEAHIEEYGKVPNSKVFTQEISDTPHGKKVNYTLEVSTALGLNRIVSELLVYEVNDRLKVSFDVGQRYVGQIKERSCIYFSYKLDDGSEQVIYLEKRRADPNGLLDIAERIFYQYDIDIMETIYARSLKP